jgi:hypothetical protein
MTAIDPAMLAMIATIEGYEKHEYAALLVPVRWLRS